MYFARAGAAACLFPTGDVNRNEFTRGGIGEVDNIEKAVAFYEDVSQTLSETRGVALYWLIRCLAC